MMSGASMMSDAVLNGIEGGGMSVQVMFLACNIYTLCYTSGKHDTCADVCWAIPFHA